MAQPLRSRLLAAATLGAALTLGGCSFASPYETQDLYAPSDGTRLEVADGVSVENLLVVTAAEGEEGRVIGTVVNNGQDRVEVTIDLVTETLPVAVEANSVVDLTEQDVTVPSTNVPPGGVLEATVSTPQTGSHALDVPVLDGRFERYSEYVPGA